MRTKSFGGLTLTIDRPKGTVKTWPQPGGGEKRFVYPCDYGFLPGHKGEDGEGLDFFVGDSPQGHLESFQKLDAEGRLDETKFLVGVTDAERETIYRLYGREVWHRKVYEDLDALTRDLPKFARRTKDRYKMAAEDDLYAVLTKEAGALDALRRAGSAVRGFFGAHTPTAMPLQSVRPHADIVHRPVLVERPALVPPYPTGHPTVPVTQVPPSPHVPTTQPMPVTRARPTVPVPGLASATGPSTPSSAFVPPSGYKPYTAAISDPTPVRTGRTPVERTSMQDMFMQAPGAQQSMQDLRVRAALGARPTSGGGVDIRKPGTTNALVEHLMRQHPGAEVTPDLILQAVKTPEYLATRTQYKGASVLSSAKLAALARFGFKLAAKKQAASKKRADIDKRLEGEVLVAGPTGAGAQGAGDTLARLAGPMESPGEMPGTKTAAPSLLYDVAPSFASAMDAFDAERNRQSILEAQKDAIRYPASHYTQPTMMQFANGGGDIASAPAPTHHRHRRHHH